jgi:hypothetical protein
MLYQFSVQRRMQLLERDCTDVVASCLEPASRLADMTDGSG